jgi:hypothetical protein
MSQNQEIIEAKLCAYIDGELDPDAQSEIEKHLEANPQHRRLLESLKATRDLLRWLPREQAPPELSETLNGQLERSVLLDYEGDSLRIRAWPRVFAAAAIILLTAGLGVAVFYALPRSQKPSLATHTPIADTDSARRFSFNTPSAGPTVSDSIASATPSDPEKQVETLSRSPRGALGKEMVFGKGGPEPLKADGSESAKLSGIEAKPSQQIMANGGAVANARNLGDIDQLADQVAQNPEVFSANANTFAFTPSRAVQMPASPQNAMVMLVRSDVPQQTEKQLTTYLDSQQIQWRQTQFPQQQQQQQQQPAPNFQSVAANSSVNNQVAANSLQNNQFAQENNKALPESEANWRKDSAPQPPGEKDKAAIAGKNAGGEILAKNEAAPPGAAPVAAQTQPAIALDDTLASHPTPTTAPAMPAIEAQAKGSIGQTGFGLRQSVDYGADNNSYHANGIFVCQMSRRQAAQLSSTISRDAYQAAQVKDVAGYGNSVAQDTPSGKLQPAEKHEMARAAGNGGAEQAEASTTHPAERERVVESKLAIAPNSSTSLRAELADRFKAPTTQPMGGATDERLSYATNVPTTQPVDLKLSPTTAPADEPVNVVILIEANPPAASAGAAAVPSTQPAEPAVQQSVPAAATQGVENAK